MARRDIGRRIACKKMALTGSEKVADLWEVVVDGQPLNAGATGYFGDGCPRRTDLLVEGDGGGDDTFPCLPLTISPSPELVPARMG
jgi:hypothetical protein